MSSTGGYGIGGLESGGLRGRPRRGFSVVELLVVVAIIAVLLAIVVPGIGRAKELARRAVCMTSLRGLAQACHSYAAEREQRLPNMHDYGGSQYNASSYWLSLKWRRMLMDEYAIRRCNFYCPSNQAGWNLDTLWEHQDKYSIVAYPYFGANDNYSVNETWIEPKLLVTPPPKYPVFARTLVDAPAYTVLWADLTRQTPAGDYWIYEAGGFGTRRGANHYLRGEPEGITEAHVDEHAEWVPWADRTNAMSIGGWRQHW